MIKPECQAFCNTAEFLDYRTPYEVFVLIHQYLLQYNFDLNRCFITPDYTSLQFPNIDVSMDAVNDDDYA